MKRCENIFNEMKILYAIQGTGNGHLSRATEILPILKEMADVDVLVSGIHSDLKLPINVDYKLYGLSFINGKKGGVSFWKTVKSLRLGKFIRDISKLSVANYDLVISDFEPVSAWACFLKGKKCIGLSHQNATLHKNAPRPPRRDPFGKLVLKYYAPVSEKYGFHFESLNSSNFTPVIRSGIRKVTPQNEGHYTVYLPAYSDNEIYQLLELFDYLPWQVFSKQCKNTYKRGAITFNPISMDGFTESFINCKGILTTAGFETPAEALFMGKKLCVVPTKNQYEQECNAAFLAELGVTVIYNLRKQHHLLADWVINGEVIKKEYEDLTTAVLTKVIDDHLNSEAHSFFHFFPKNTFNLLQLKAIRGNNLISLDVFNARRSRFISKLKNLF